MAATKTHRPAKYLWKPGDKHAYVERDCDLCGKTYIGRKDISKYCSQVCSGRATNPRKTVAKQIGFLRCVKCRVEKPEEAFPLWRKSPTGRKPRCRQCRADDWQETKTPEILERNNRNGRIYRALNREKEAARIKRWADAHPESRLKADYRRRARRRSGEIVGFKTSSLPDKWAYWGGRCWMCGGIAVEWDHVKPLASGGLHALANLRPACRACNAHKSHLWPYPTCSRPSREVA